MTKTKEDWEYFGKNDPYYAVATFDKFRKENLTESSKEDFFQTGYEHIKKLWNEIQTHFVEEFKPRKALDFGCGVGRLTIPLAERCGQVVGVDISESMLEEAARNCEKRNIQNISFLQTEEFLSGVNDEYDFVHTFIVLQHIKPERGERIVKKIIDSLVVGGIGVLHVTYASSISRRDFWKYKLYRDFPLIKQAANFIKGRKDTPLMPVYIYDLNKIFFLLQENNCHKCLARFSFHGMNGILIIFQKKKDLSY